MSATQAPEGNFLAHATRVGEAAESALRRLDSGEIDADQAVQEVVEVMRQAIARVQASREPKPTDEPMSEAQRLHKLPGYAELLKQGYYFQGNIAAMDDWSSQDDFDEVAHRADFLRYGYEEKLLDAYIPATGERLADHFGYFLRPIPSKMDPLKRDGYMTSYHQRIISQGGTPISYDYDLSARWL